LLAAITPKQNVIID
jgi:hypothetical protein